MKEKINYDNKEIEFGPLLIKDKQNLSYFNNIKESLFKIYYSSKDEKIKIKLEYLDEIIKSLSDL